MNLASGVDKTISLEQRYNGTDIAITPVGGNIRFIDLTREVLSEMSTWEIRTAEIVVAITDSVEGTFEAVDAAKLRQGEYVGFYDADDDFLGGGIITSISGTTVTYKLTKNTSLTEANITQIILDGDPILLEGRTKPICSKEFNFMVVQADATVELSIEILQVGNSI